MKLLFIIPMLLISSLVYAEWEHYAIETVDDGVAILAYNLEAKDTLQDVIRDSGFEGRPKHEITTEDVPEGGPDRHAWEWRGGRIQINQAKKAAKDAERAAKQGRRNGHLQRLGITEDEFQELVHGAE